MIEKIKHNQSVFNFYSGTNEKGEIVEGYLAKVFNINDDAEAELNYMIIDENSFSIKHKVSQNSLRRFSGFVDFKGKKIYEGDRCFLTFTQENIECLVRWDSKRLQYGLLPLHEHLTEIPKTNSGFLILDDLKIKLIKRKKFETPRTKGHEKIDLVSAVSFYREGGIKSLKQGFREPRKEKDNVYVKGRNTGILTPKSYKAVVSSDDFYFTRLFPVEKTGNHLFVGDILQFYVDGKEEFEIAEIVEKRNGYSLKTPDEEEISFDQISNVFVIGHKEVNPLYMKEDIKLELVGENLSSESEIVFTTKGVSGLANTFYDRKEKKFISPYFLHDLEHLNIVEFPEDLTEDEVRFKIKDKGE